MKKFLYLLLLLLQSVAYGQQPEVEKVVANNMPLKRIVQYPIIKIENPKDVRMRQDYVYLNGQPAPNTLKRLRLIEDVPMSGFDQSVIATFTPEERVWYKNEMVYIYLVFNNTGQVLEVAFTLEEGTRVENIPLSKFVTWTQNIKKYVKAKITDPRAKQLQFIQDMVFYVMP